jgi:hypothetical protein
VLHDGEPKGERIVDGRSHSVFDEILLFEASELPAHTVTVSAGAGSGPTTGEGSTCRAGCRVRSGAAAERCDLRSPLPVGYVYDDEGACVIDPDDQAAIGDVFAAFAAIRRCSPPCAYAWYSHGFSVSAPVRARCLMFRLTNVQPLAMAVAAISASGGSMLVPAILSCRWMAR